MKRLLLAMMLLYGCDADPTRQTPQTKASVLDNARGVEGVVTLSNGVQIKGFVKGTPGNYEIFLPGDKLLKFNDKTLYDKNKKIWMIDLGASYPLDRIDAPGMLWEICSDGKTYFREQLPENCYDEKR